ncbi:hypothetical protein V3595_16435 [Bacillus sp. CFBP9009]
MFILSMRKTIEEVEINIIPLVAAADYGFVLGTIVTPGNTHVLS